MRLFWVSWEDFVFAHAGTVTTGLPNLVPPRHIGDCSATTLSPLRTLWSAVIKFTKVFRSGHDCTSASSTRSPCYIESWSTFHKSDPSEKCVNTLCLHGTLVPRLHWKIMRRSGSLCTSLHQISPTLFGSTFIKLLRIPFFLSCFSVSVESCNGSPRSSSFIPPFLSDIGASTSLFADTESLLADVDSCDEDGDEADEGAVEEELAEVAGTTNGT